MLTLSLCFPVSYLPSAHLRPLELEAVDLTVSTFLPPGPRQSGEMIHHGVMFLHMLFPTVSCHPLFSSYTVETSLVSMGGQSGAPSVR